ncbi:Rpn family recombination-promoting nuclease/putative transposase [Candidiatus Paracoxiella cheracis]|uniref:Rpn family recombination-promoting nuclease/putative transposase n=1 Tax=Candidiatus Paracoxiella cheracis TaxID=3405120 RepID=UPI003BF48EBD
MFLILFFRTNVVYNVKFFFGFYVKQFLIIFINLSKVQYAVELNEQPGYLYTLVEHQRKPDPLMPYRILRYQLRIMDQHLKKHHTQTLPVIVPLVFYNGEQLYPYSTDLFDLFGDHAQLARQTLLEPFTLVDVTQIPDEKLKQLQWAGIMEFTQKHIFARDFMPFLRELIPLLKRLHEAGAQDYLLSTLTYLFQADIENPAEVATIIGNEVSRSLGEELMSLAEKLEHRGFQKGIVEGETIGLQKGRAEGRSEGEIHAQHQIARNMLAQQADPLFVSKVTGLSLEEIQALSQDDSTDQ